MGDAAWDLIIVGGGPAGFAAAIYAGRARLRTLLLEKATIGGQIANADRIENYPGFPEPIAGYELAPRFSEHAQKYGVRSVNTEVTGVELQEDVKTIVTSGGTTRARAVIFAGGGDHRKLGVPGEEEYTGKGVSYCAVCDGALFQDEPVAVVGGGDTALDEAITLTQYASKVTVVHRRRELRAVKALQEKASGEPKIEFRWDSTIQRIKGNDFVDTIELRDLASGAVSNLPVSGIFVSIGNTPNTGYLASALPLDKGGHIPVNLWMETPVPGVFAAGEVRQQSAKQVATAIGDGVTAAIAAERYLRGGA